jgi:NAD(P)-dependent dehydrogenase (short-subunit alcohol dehydrogenase family)
MEIKDRVFIVTGASSGIGLSTAIALSKRGGKVIGTEASRQFSVHGRHDAI